MRKDSLGKGLESKRQQRSGKTEGGEGEGVGRGECEKQSERKGRRNESEKGRKATIEG